MAFEALRAVASEIVKPKSKFPLVVRTPYFSLEFNQRPRCENEHVRRPLR